MRTVHTEWILIALGSALLTSCSDSAGVLPRLSATYVLETVNGERLPNVADGGSIQLVKLADTLVFSPDGNLDRRVTNRLIGYSTLTPDTTVHSVSAFVYSIDGDRLTIGVRSCPSNANCIGPSSGRIDAQSVDLIDSAWNNATLHFTVR